MMVVMIAFSRTSCLARTMVNELARAQGPAVKRHGLSSLLTEVSLAKLTMLVVMGSVSPPRRAERLRFLD